VERATRWLVRTISGTIEIEKTVRRFEPGAKLLCDSRPDVLQGIDREAFDERMAQLMDAGVSDRLAAWVASMSSLPPVFDIVAVAEATDRKLEQVMVTYFGLGYHLELNWLRDRILELSRANRWQALARAALRDDLLSAHRDLTREVLETAGDGAAGEKAIERWSKQKGGELERALSTLADIRASRTYDTTTLPVALREVRRLTNANGRDSER
jgi:glutamate dehydrogenase